MESLHWGRNAQWVICLVTLCCNVNVIGSNGVYIVYTGQKRTMGDLSATHPSHVDRRNSLFALRVDLLLYMYVRICTSFQGVVAIFCVNAPTPMISTDQQHLQFGAPAADVV